jgi:hypothetical protein|nr:MAG TPA: hypothetical protein [Caudoviricetes sp.]
MKKELIQINIDALIKAYKESSNDCKNTLESLFGEEIFKSKDITERIKTFEDACNELGIEHPFVRSYNLWKNYGGYNQPDADAYFKLRIICAALNEGWEPQFTKDEWRYFPWFTLYTQKEIDEMDEEQKSRVVHRSYSYAYASGGVAYAYASSVASHAHTGFGSRLAFKSKELAIYAGEQFVEIWANYVFKP